MFRKLFAALPVAALLLGGALAMAPDRARAQGAPAAPLAERAPHVVEMLEALRLYEILGIMATEGIEAALTLEGDLFPGAGGAAWAAEANRINGADRLTELFEDAFPVDLMAEAHAAQVTEFFTAEPGARIAAAEVAGRRAFLEPGVEELANEAFREAVAEEDPRVDLLTEFIETNDLVERNVSGALNSNFAFYRGLSDGGAFEGGGPRGADAGRGLGTGTRRAPRHDRVALFLPALGLRRAERRGYRGLHGALDHGGGRGAERGAVCGLRRGVHAAEL